MEKTDYRELLEVHRNVIDVKSIAFLMILLALEVSFVNFHMRSVKDSVLTASTKMTLGSRLVYHSEMLLGLLIHQSVFLSYSEHSQSAYFRTLSCFSREGSSGFRLL